MRLKHPIISKGRAVARGGQGSGFSLEIETTDQFTGAGTNLGGQGSGFSLEIETDEAIAELLATISVAKGAASRLRLKRMTFTIILLLLGVAKGAASRLRLKLHQRLPDSPAE